MPDTKYQSAVRVDPNLTHTALQMCENSNVTFGRFEGPHHLPIINQSIIPATQKLGRKNHSLNHRCQQEGRHLGEEADDAGLPADERPLLMNWLNLRIAG